MDASSREFAVSSNGDRWSLGLDENTGHPHVIHQANIPSGGTITRSEVGEFLRGQDSPERQALLELIGTLVCPEEPAIVVPPVRPRWTD